MPPLGVDTGDHDDHPQPRPNPGELLRAAKAGDVARVESLLEHGADIEEKDDVGDTPLNEAARCNKLEVVELLLAKGAQVNVPNRSGHTALWWAEHYGYTSVVQRLKEEIANPQLQLRFRQPQENWVLMAAEKVALVGTYPLIKKQLTYIFDFASRERMIITDDLKTHAEAATPAVSFDDLAPAIYETALAHFQELGGKVDAEFVRRGNRRLDKKGLG